MIIFSHHFKTESTSELSSSCEDKISRLRQVLADLKESGANERKSTANPRSQSMHNSNCYCEKNKKQRRTRI